MADKAPLALVEIDDIEPELALKRLVYAREHAERVVILTRLWTPLGHRDRLKRQYYRKAWPHLVLMLCSLHWRKALPSRVKTYWVIGDIKIFDDDSGLQEAISDA